MPSNGYYYIAVKARAFKTFVCDFIALVDDCYILHFRILEGRLITFDPNILFQNVTQSHEELQDDLCP